MSDEINDRNIEDIESNNNRDNDIDLPISRLSSASKKSQEQQFNFVNNSSIDESSNGKRIKSAKNSHKKSNEFNQDLLTNENESSIDSIHYEEQIYSQNNNETTLDQQENLIKYSIDLSTDDENDQQLTTSTRFKNIPKALTPPVEDDKPKNLSPDHPSCQFRADKKWLDLQFHEQKTDEKSDTKVIKKPDELEEEMEDPPGKINPELLNRIQGSIVGMALGDILGAHVEFRPHQFLKENPVTTLVGGGTWGLEKGQFTDDTSMGLCLANSLIARRDFIPYDQLVRYKWWSDSGYMSSTGQCFDIGAATSQSIHEFKRKQIIFAKENNIPDNLIDQLSDPELLSNFDPYCSEDDVAGNGALMRLAPVPLFFFRNKYAAIEFSGRSGMITHGDKKAYDACRFYGALIVAALRGFNKNQILANNFYDDHKHWFGEEPLHKDIVSIAQGSYKMKGGYDEGIRGKGYIVNALEAALWAFWSDGGSFETGALAAVNLGDDTDTTAAIYGQLAGAYYGYKDLPSHWLEYLYAHKFMKTLSKWIAYEGEQWEHNRQNSFIQE